VNSEEDEIGAGAQAEVEADTPPVTKINVKFSQAREHGIKAKYPRSFGYFRRQHEEETWTQLNHRHDPSELAKIYTSVTESETPFYCLSRQDYLDLAFPKFVEVNPVNPEGTKTKATLERIPFLEMKGLSLQNQLRHIMFSGKQAYIIFIGMRLNRSFETTKQTPRPTLN